MNGKQVPVLGMPSITPPRYPSLFYLEWPRFERAFRAFICAISHLKRRHCQVAHSERRLRQSKALLRQIVE